jgi:ceroid-lipofuscinosis protein 8
MFVDKRLSIDHTLASTDESWIFISVLTGFFLFEELSMIYFDLRYQTCSLELHVHHIFALIGFGFPAFYNVCHYYAAQLFMLQTGTPFSCISWCLLKLNYQQTKIWKINQWIVVYAYQSRTFYELWCWYTFYQDWEGIKQNIPWLYTAAVFLGLGIITVWLTPYWTYKKTSQFFSPGDWECRNERKQRE